MAAAVYPLRPIGALSLFGAIMSGYLISVLVPFGFSTLARAWIVARREALATAGVLASVALDRLTDGIVFASLVPVALLSVTFSDPTGDIHAALAWGAGGSAVSFSIIVIALFRYGGRALERENPLGRFVARLPTTVAQPVRRALTSFAAAIMWPSERWRGAAILCATVVMKLLAATHFYWAGLALGAVLRPGEYLFLLVFLGFLVILGHFARIAGGFVIGGVFALGLFGVPREVALAMVLIVQAASVLTVTTIGAIAMWRMGIAPADVRAAAPGSDVTPAARRTPVSTPRDQPRQDRWS